MFFFNSLQRNYQLLGYRIVFLNTSPYCPYLLLSGQNFNRLLNWHLRFYFIAYRAILSNAWKLCHFSSHKSIKNLPLCFLKEFLFQKRKSKKALKYAKKKVAKSFWSTKVFLLIKKFEKKLRQTITFSIKISSDFYRKNLLLWLVKRSLKRISQSAKIPSNTGKCVVCECKSSTFIHIKFVEISIE